MTTATFKAPPGRFEPGTPAISQTVALHAAVRYLQDLGMERVAAQRVVLAALRPGPQTLDARRLAQAPAVLLPVVVEDDLLVELVDRVCAACHHASPK